MKRRDLIRYLEMHGCELSREGAKHSVYWNPANRKILIDEDRPTIVRQGFRIEPDAQISRAAPHALQNSPKVGFCNKGRKLTNAFIDVLGSISRHADDTGFRLS